MVADGEATGTPQVAIGLITPTPARILPFWPQLTMRSVEPFVVSHPVFETHVSALGNTVVLPKGNTGSAPHCTELIVWLRPCSRELHYAHVQLSLEVLANLRLLHNATVGVRHYTGAASCTDGAHCTRAGVAWLTAGAGPSCSTLELVH